MWEQIQYLGYYGVAGVKHVLRQNKPIQPDNHYVLDTNHANDWIREHILSGEPFMAGRLGSGEMLAYLKTCEVKMGLRKHIPEGNMDSMCINAGFFPRSEEKIMAFGALMEKSSAQVDLLGIWGTIPMEPYLLKTRFQRASLCKLGGLEPFFADRPWSSALKGKRVLVIHPFEETIKSQYAKRDKLFPGTDILPEFDLLTLKAVQTIAGTKDERFADWFEALDYMVESALKIPFDVAIIGCGAYGFPLAAKLKAAGKQVIHLGGSTQLLFGIRGRRWEERQDFATLMNEDWCRPLENETPQGAKKIENSCYW